MAIESQKLVAAACNLARRADRLQFKPPVTHVYNPLDYAWAAHELYLQKFGNGKKRVVFLGMNPGPFGMVQTGIPFGEIAAVRDWLKIFVQIKKPADEHAKRLISGFDCHRSEVSGRRLWGLFAERFGSPENFFADHFVVNYCPLAFCEKSGCNRTPDKLPPAERNPLLKICDEHLRRVLEILEPEWLIGIGDFAARCGKEVCGKLQPLKLDAHWGHELDAGCFPLPLGGEGLRVRGKNEVHGKGENAPTAIRVGQILHPSPANPAANRGWAKRATEQLIQLGVWSRYYLTK